MTRSIFLAATATAAIALSAAPAEAQREKRDRISPYIDAGQVLTADLNGGDVLTYSTIGAGIDATIQRRRVEVQVSYNYEHRFSYDKKTSTDNIHSGLARAAVKVAPGFTIEGGALATRARSDMRGDAPTNLAGNVRNISQVYSAYAGPSFTTREGPIQTSAAYRFGYTKVENPGATGVSAGLPRLDNYDDSKLHVATASAGFKSGTILPVGVTVSGAWEREDAGQLDQRYDGKYARGDVVLPIGGGFAVGAGAGYENIRISQRDPLRDGTGTPITDGNGRQITDPASPRRTAYATDGLIWDAGIIYRPNRRLYLEARAGRRYGSMSYTGSLSYEMARGTGLQVGVYDSVTTFGRQLNGGIAMLPTSFNTTVDPFGDQFNNCVFGTSGGAAGGCLSGVFQSIPTASYRARGVDAVFVVNRGRTRMGLGLGYANRRFYAPSNSGLFTIDGVTDQSFYGQFFVGRELSRRSGIVANIFGSYYEPGLPGTDTILGGGLNATYYYNIGRLGLNASAGLFGVDQGGGSDLGAQAQVGMRYQF